MYPPSAVARVEERMADFCRECSIATFGYDTGDHRLGKLPADHYWEVICEGCGFIQVDELGNCMRCDLMQTRKGHNGDKLGPLEGGRRWHQPELRDFTFGNYDEGTIELGAPLWDHLHVIQVTCWRFGHRRLERKLSQAEYPQWGIFGRYVIELGAPIDAGLPRCPCGDGGILLPRYCPLHTKLRGFWSFA